MARRTCGFCKAPLPADARPNRKYCDDDCKRGRPPRATEPAAGDDVDDVDDVELGEVARGTETAIAQARTDKRITALDGGTVAAIRVLARKIDEEQARWDYCLAFADWHAGDKVPPKPPTVDNVSIPTYLRYAESLGLTPAGRGRIPGAPKEGGAGGKLGGHLSAVKKPGERGA